MNRARFFRAPLHRTSGLAMIMVLGVLAIMAVLLLALFQGSSHQLRTSASAGVIAKERMLSDTAAALVIGQIAKASTQAGQTWISQPGLIRTYGISATRTPTACYKLYSTTNLAAMTDISGNVNFFTNDVPIAWISAPNQFTDINAPVTNTSGSGFYAVIDPAALTNAQNQTAGTQIAGVSSDNAAVTMPVAWLYELQDGTLGPASGGSATNPIVARLAFWTDDDTSKININTAGYGTPWNAPHANSTDDAAWSTNQPAAGEYSAYPGHPATTSLAMVFGTNAYAPAQLLALTPRYAVGGSQFGTQPTTAGETISPKNDRLYASLDELCLSSTITGTSLRQVNPVTPSQLELARFVLTAHSVAPEITLLGEPRVVMWPIADSTSAGAPRITAADRAIAADATVGTGTATRDYYFLRHNALSTNDDLNPAIVPSNAQLFGDLVARGNLTLPGYGTSLAAKYPGASWSQILLEMVDYIRCINAVDPSPAPFVSYAAGDSTGVGRGFVEPIVTNYTSTTGTVTTLRGFGRCPTLSSLTLVFYMCGFSYTASGTTTTIDFEANPDAGGAYWKSKFNPVSNLTNATAELVRAFVVPETFQPGCAYPEVSDNCDIQIQGLNNIGIATTTSNDFGFSTTATSVNLGKAALLTPAERAWGGSEGPLAWRASSYAAQQSGTFTYAFAGTKAYSIPLAVAQRPKYTPATGVLTWPVNMTPLNFKGASVAVLIRDASGNPLQTLALAFPANAGVPAPTPEAEYTQDGAGNPVWPSYYMTLRNRLLLTATNREFMVQPGDVTRAMMANTDLRVMAGLASVPATFFTKHPLYSTTGAASAHNIHFADGTAVYGAIGTTSLVTAAKYATGTTTLTWTDWTSNATTNYAWPINAPCSCPLAPPAYVVMPGNFSGDWDTGFGLSPDGAQINLPDAGTSLTPATAYLSLAGDQPGAATQRTPNAQVTSPVIFGSLPVGINATNAPASQPWRTLLFCPYPAADGAHPGFGNATASPPIAPDHLVLDNFWMPVVEPYGISECMATRGKINLNDQIAPFIYLHRNTALRALFDSLRIPVVPASVAYKAPGTALPSIWHPVDADATVAQIENKFVGADAYLSESEICTVPLVPVSENGGSVAATKTMLDAFWLSSAARLTGDNLREQPYAQLYSRLTTRSNSYTVHIRVQVLKKRSNDPQQNIWNESIDLVQGEWRGSYEIERYLDPAASAPAAGSLLGPYKFRIVSTRRFAP